MLLHQRFRFQHAGVVDWDYAVLLQLLRTCGNILQLLFKPLVVQEQILHLREVRSGGAEQPSKLHTACIVVSQQSYVMDLQTWGGVRVSCRASGEWCLTSFGTGDIQLGTKGVRESMRRVLTERAEQRWSFELNLKVGRLIAAHGGNSKQHSKGAG